MKEHKISRNTNEQRELYKAWNKERVRITNLVNRSHRFEKVCCICGKEAEILHNRKRPYYIAFICRECRKDSIKLKEAEKYRFDLRDEISSVTNFTDDKVTSLIEGYISENKNIGDYCNIHQISRYQFNKLIEKYEKIKPNIPIRKLIKEQSERIRIASVKKAL